MDTFRLESRRRGELPQDEESAGTREGAALRVEEELRPVPPVEKRPAAGKVPAQRVDRLATDRNDALLVALADAADEPLIQVHGAALETDRLRHSQPGAVQQLDERAVAKTARSRPRGGLDQALGLARRERARKCAAATRRVEVRRGIVLAGADESLVAEERAQRSRPARDRRGGEASGAGSTTGVPLRAARR